MSLAKRGSSVIAIDDVKYRWVVSGNDGFLNLVVEHSHGKGQRLCVQFEYSDGDMTPGTVREIIIQATKNGWTPFERAKEIKFKYCNQHLVPWDDWIAET